MKTRFRLLAIDIDGTLLDTRFQLSAANREAVVAAHARGAEVVLVTGRRFTFAQPIAAQFPIPLTVIASNGALVKAKDGATLWRQLLPRATARTVLAAAGPFRERALLLFDREAQGQIVVENLDPRHAPVDGYFERNRAYLLLVERLEDALTEDPIQVLFAGPVAPLRELEQRLLASPCAPAISVALAEYPQRDFTLLDVLDRGCNKGQALARYAAQRGLGREDILAIGDNWNDREMLEFAGFPVLMANSSEELKARGWAVTASNDEDGVAAALIRYVLSD